MNSVEKKAYCMANGGQNNNDRGGRLTCITCNKPITCQAVQEEGLYCYEKSGMDCQCHGSGEGITKYGKDGKLGVDCKSCEREGISNPYVYYDKNMTKEKCGCGKNRNG